jgi:hypothetical protein
MGLNSEVDIASLNNANIVNRDVEFEEGSVPHEKPAGSHFEH